MLRPQSQNTIRSDILRTNSGQNKITVDTKSIKALSLKSVQHNLENQDPESSGQVRPPHVRPGVSRLPVLAKSLYSQTLNEFTDSHSKWEEKPLAGKVKRKKPSTRPIPFNLSQPKSTRVASENQHHAIHSARTSQPKNNVCSSQVKTTIKVLKHSATLQESIKFTKSSENTSQSLGQSRQAHKTSATVSKPLNSIDAANKLSAAEICSKNMNLLSLKDSSSITKMDNFQHDHSALLSILRNEGVTSTMTSQSKSYNYLPQRVSVMKSCQKAKKNAGCFKSVAFTPEHGALQSILKNEGVKAGAPSHRTASIYTPMRVPVKKNVSETEKGVLGSSMKMVPFSLDAGALQSILQNEGVKIECTTLRTSVCPSGRGTSIYTARRVPVKKHSVAPSPGREVAVHQTPVQKWTPQRVTSQQPMSAVKWHISQPSPYAITPGFRSCKPSLCPKQEEVVQKLFDEDEENFVKETIPQTKLFPDQKTCEGEMRSPEATEKEGEGLQKEEEQAMGQFPPPERESVIFFSTGKKLLRDPRFKKPEVTDHKQQNQEDTLPVLQQSTKISTTVDTVVKDLLTQTDVSNPAVAMLQRRLLCVEDLRLDEEVANYTSMSVPTVSGFHPPRPRCGNPVATLLHFEESTRFVPISFDTSPIS